MRCAFLVALLALFSFAGSAAAQSDPVFRDVNEEAVEAPPAPDAGPQEGTELESTLQPVDPVVTSDPQPTSTLAPPTSLELGVPRLECGPYCYRRIDITRERQINATYWVLGGGIIGMFSTAMLFADFALVVFGGEPYFESTGILLLGMLGGWSAFTWGFGQAVVAPWNQTTRMRRAGFRLSNTALIAGTAAFFSPMFLASAGGAGAALSVLAFPAMMGLYGLQVYYNERAFLRQSPDRSLRRRYRGVLLTHQLLSYLLVPTVSAVTVLSYQGDTGRLLSQVALAGGLVYISAWPHVVLHNARRDGAEIQNNVIFPFALGASAVLAAADPSLVTGMIVGGVLMWGAGSAVSRLLAGLRELEVDARRTTVASEPPRATWTIGPMLGRSPGIAIGVRF